MKKRLASKAETGMLFVERPFFDVDVALKVCPCACASR
jgi:hypothetical protein